MTRKSPAAGKRQYDCATMPLFRRKRHPLDEQVQQAVAEGRITYQCVYCKEGIEPAGFDPCAVIVVTNFDDENAGREQVLFAHEDCIRQSGLGGDELRVFEDEYPPMEGLVPLE